jgi:carboxyl-terminal processing protease
MSFNESAIREVVDKSVGLLDSKCIRLIGAKVDWRALFTEHFPELTGATDADDFEAKVNSVLTRGGLSHVAFFHESAQHAPARYAINATFAAADTEDGRCWIFEDVHEGGPAHAAGARPGHVLLKVNGDPIAPPKTITFALGKDHLVTIRKGDGTVEKLRLELPKAVSNGKAPAKPPMAEPTAVTARWARRGIGYLRVAFFPGINGHRFAQALDRALAELPDCSRLIIDLRGNLGGFVGSLRLISTLTPGRVPVGYSLTRRGEDRSWRPEQLPCIDSLPTTKFEMLKMAVRFKVLHRDRSIRLATEGLGARPFHGHVVMLLNEHTLSAGEMVAAFAKENQLATLVGSRTGGQVLGGANFTVGHGFILRMPAASWRTWSGAIVEGRGVQPDVEVPLAVDALRKGSDSQFEKAIEIAEAMTQSTAMPAPAPVAAVS